jgi:hypothetical protein
MIIAEITQKQLYNHGIIGYWGGRPILQEPKTNQEIADRVLWDRWIADGMPVYTVEDNHG